MRKYFIILGLLFVMNWANAQMNVSIKPLGYSETAASPANLKNNGNAVNQFGGSFRLKEIADDGQMKETDVITYAFLKDKSGSFTLHINCARFIQLHYVLTDAKSKHKIVLNENAPYQRIAKQFELSKFKDGICSLLVFDEKSNLIHTVSFDKFTQTLK